MEEMVDASLMLLPDLAASAKSELAYAHGCLSHPGLHRDPTIAARFQLRT
jgi:hypothetical protein